jgi:hypothetical protein
MKRDQALDKVKQLTMQDRNQTHGDPVTQFERAQRIKDAVGHRGNPNLTPAEIECIEMICTKLSRWTSGKAGHDDHALDIIGYASIAVEAIHATKGTYSEVTSPIVSTPPSAPADHGVPRSIAELQRATQVVDASPPPPARSEFAGIDQVARRFAPNPRKVVEAPPEGSAA